MRRLRDRIFHASWRRIVGIGILALLTLGARQMQAQPANDNIASATDLTPFDFLGTGTIPDSNVGASLETGEPQILGATGGSSVWYAWTAPSNGIVSFDTLGSDFGTLLGVYVANDPSNLSVTNLGLIVADTNSQAGLTSKVTFEAIAGATFYISVDGTNGVAGNIVLNWATTDQTAPPANDDFASATLITGNSGTIFGDNLFATGEAFETAPFFGTNSVWYAWTAPADGLVTFDTHGSDFDTLLDIYGDTNQPTFTSLFTRVENDDFMERRTSQASIPVTANTVYMISVNGFNGATGFIRLDWHFTPPPANDSFANAAPLNTSAPAGTISDNNILATAEPGEPTHAGFVPVHSLWYKFFATADGEVEMDTMGSSIDTVLAVYTGNAVGSLNQVAANDDLVVTFPRPGAGQFAQTNFSALNFDTTNIPPAPGTLIVSNQPVSLIYNGFDFAMLQPFSGLPAVGSSGSGASGLRFNAKAGNTYYIAVDGKSGNAGPFNLSWAYHSAGVFRFASENRDLTSGIPPKGFGLFSTAVNTYPGMLLYQAAETEEFGYRGGLVNINQFNSTFHTYYEYDVQGVLVTVIRMAGSSGRVTVGYTTVQGTDIHDHYSFDPVNNILVPDGAPIPLAGDAPALEDFDYTPVSGTLTFNDFEMSKTILIPIVDDFGIAQPNRDFSVVLYNPQKDAQESTLVSQPRLDPVFSQALVRILDADLDPRGPSRVDLVVTNIDTVNMVTNVNTNTMYSLQSTNAIFNFLKANYRIPEDVGDFWGNTPITVYVNRSGTNTAGASIFYRVDSHFLDNVGSFDNNEFPLQPGSDYATPTPTNAFGFLSQGPSDFSGTDNGTLTWGTDDRDPKPITFNINNDTNTEFNEDFHIELYDIVKNVTVQVGMINETTVTIMFDDQDPPAGSVDELYNPDFGVQMFPPVGTEPRGQPGTDTQGQVNAIAIQPDNKSILGGTFSTYNGTTRHGLTRVNTDGEVDTSFDPGDAVSIVTGDFITSLGLQPDGKVVVAGRFASFNGQSCGNVVRLNTNGTIDANFRIAAGLGANGTIRSIVVRGDGKIVVAGEFTTFNNVSRLRVARLNSDGSLDTSFDPGTALNDAVYTLAPAASLPIGVNGNANGTDVEYTNIVSLPTNSGVLTINYNMFTIPDDLRVYYGNTNTTAGTGVLIFDTGLVNGTNLVVIPFGPTNGVNANTIEIVMNQGNGIAGSVWQFNASVLPFVNDALTIGGDFTSAGGVFGQDHIARLLGNGSLDTTFDPGSGANGRVRTIVSQVDGKVVAGGDFTIVNGQGVNHIVRLNPNGSTDSEFFSGIGTDAGVYSLNYIPPVISVNQVVVGTNIVTQFTTNGETIYAGGPFTLFNGTHRLGFARLNIDGSVDTTFLDTAYNQFAGLPRSRFGDLANAVFVSALQSDGKVMIGGSFSQVGGGQFDPEIRPDSFDLNQYKEPKVRDGVRNRSNVARLIGGGTPGPGNIGLATSSYGSVKSQGFIYTQLVRTNGSLGSASANFSVLPGTAQSVSDYVYNGEAPVYGTIWDYFLLQPTRMHSEGLFGLNTVMSDNFGNPRALGLNGMPGALVTINNNPANPGDVHAQFQLSNPGNADQFFLGGQNIPLGVALGRTISPLNIVDDGRKAGSFGFTSPTYAGSASVPISVARTNGNFNSTPLQISFATSAGSNTFSGIDYIDTNGVLTFNNGDTLKVFNVQVIQSNYISAVEKTANLRLFNFPPNASVGLSNAVLRIINPNFQGFLNFSAPSFAANLSASTLQVTVQRTVGSKGTLDVTCATTNGTAIAGVDYVGTTNTLHWNNGDVSPRTMTIPLINNGGIGGTKVFFANIYSPLLNGSGTPSVLGTLTNATLTINNDNNYGTFQFSSPTYVVNEATNGVATITVTRAGSTLSNAVLSVATVDGTAHAGVNYVATNGTVSFVQGQVAASFGVRILNDGVTNGLPFFFNVVLSNASPGAVLGSPTNALVNILDAQSFNRPPGSGDVTFNPQNINGDVLAIALQDDGQIIAGGSFTGVNGVPKGSFARFAANGNLDLTFLSGLAGANGAVNAVSFQSNSRILVAGAFSQINGVVRNHIARVATDGSLDTSFNPGSGADNSIFALTQIFNNGVRKIYVGGAFTVFASGLSSGIERLSDDGSLDQTFTGTGVNGTVYAIAAYPTNSVNAGKIIIGGSFTTVNGSSQTNIARLNIDGSLDTNFVANADDIVHAVAIQNDEEIVIGGDFATVNGVTATRLARLNNNGSVDASFVGNISPGADATVEAIAVQADNRIVVAGQFVTASGVTRHRITRLLPNGLLDPTINFGDGANGDIDALAIQPADQMIVIGGGFTEYNDQQAPHLMRIYGGSATGSGAFEFTTAAYTVNENGLQANITVRRTGGTSGLNADGSGNVSVQFATTPGTAVPGINYTTTVTNVVFPPGEVLETVFVPVRDDLVVGTNTTVNLALFNPVAGTALGDQTNAVLTILDTDSSVSFLSATYQIAKNTPTGLATISIIRHGGTNATSLVDFATTTNGTAVIGTDYTPTNLTVTFNPGDVVKTVQVGVTNNNLPEGNRTVTMVLSNIVNSTLVAPTNATLTIVDTVFSPGQLCFATTNFTASENNGTATITVIRTNGSSGSVSVFYYTTPGTAVPGVNYITVSNNISFADGQTNRTFTIPLVDNNIAQGPVSLTVSLTPAPGSPATLIAPTNALVTIQDNDAGFAFVNATNIVPETAGQVAVNVLRIGPTNSSISVDYATHDGTAVAGSNYTTTSGTLSFSPGQVQKSIVVPLIDDPLVTGDVLFTVALTNATAGVQLAYPSTNTVIIHDADAGLSFTNSTMIVRRDAGSALVTVICSNPSIEPVILNSNTIPLSVQFRTSDGTAAANVDYLATTGTLIFTNGLGTNTFNVPIINNSTITGDRTFNVKLFNPTPPGRLVAPSNLVVTIVDGTAGFRFSSKTYTANKTDGFKTINVTRTGLTDSVAQVDFTATNGSAIAGVHFTATNGTLIFTNGVTNQTFDVQVLDTTAVQPNETVLLQLFNPSNSVLTAPSAATLTIKDNTGSFVVPAGSALVSEIGAGAPNGVIDSNETVTVLFGFRDAGGLNVNNLIATLIATNGVTPSPNPATQTYGALVSNSHSASQPFTFIAQGTNGQQITAVFLLKDGTTNIGTGVFGYTLGSSTSYYTNGSAIVINDNAIANPYPATIAISNLPGAVLKATITLTNLTHGSPRDIDALLVSPEQQTVLFMAHAGLQNSINGVTLTFDDAASSSLPQSGQIISGTNKPTAYLPVPVFP